MNEDTGDPAKSLLQCLAIVLMLCFPPLWPVLGAIWGASVVMKEKSE